MADKPPRNGKRRVALLAALVLVLGLVIGWQNYWARHKLLRVVTGVEGLAHTFLPAPEDPPAVPTWYLHRAPVDDALAPVAIEIDVCFTSDFVPYLSHGDDHLGATPDSLDFQSLTADEVEATTRNDGARFLTLAAFIESHAVRHPEVILDVKTDHANAAPKAEAMAALIGDDTPRYIITSLSGRFLFELRDRLPTVAMGCEPYRPVAAWLAGFDGFHAPLGNLTDADDKAARALGLRRLYFTAATPDDRARVLRLAPHGAIATQEAGVWDD